MNPCRKHAARRLVPFALAFIAFVFIAGLSFINAQQGRTRDLSNNERDIREREKVAETTRDPRSVLAEVNQDMEHLRTLGDDLKKAFEAASLDHKTVAATADEIKKRATRLKKNLSGLPKAEKEEKRPKDATPADDAQMKASLQSLDQLITSFLTNPVFSDMGTLDPQLAVKARRDLEGILSLSETIKKSADKLAKS